MLLTRNVSWQSKNTNLQKYFFPVIIDKPGDPKYIVDCNCVKRTSVAVCEQAAFPLGPCDDPDESLCCVQKIVKRRWWPWG